MLYGTLVSQVIWTQLYTVHVGSIFSLNNKSAMGVFLVQHVTQIVMRVKSNVEKH